MRWLPVDNFRSPAALSRFFLTMLAGLALDLWTKSLAFNKLVNFIVKDEDGGTLVDSETYRVIPGWLHFHATANEGAVFGIGQGYVWFFVLVSIGAIGVLTYLFATSGRDKLYQIILGLLLAGVLGNMYDRIALGYVRDMIHILPQWGVFPWIFNVADCLLCVGVAAMIVYTYFTTPGKEAVAAEDKTSRSS